VNTVTTLGATFSTIGAKLVITPGCIGVVSCAAAENALAEMHSTAPIDKPKDRKIPVCINVSLQGIARSTAAGHLLTQLATKVERAVLRRAAVMQERLNAVTK
jgi:hypothetical protein